MSARRLRADASFDHLPDLDAVHGHRNGLAASRRQVLAHVVGAYRKLAVPTVDHDGELHRLRPTEILQRIERCPDSAAGEQHVVDQHDGATGELDRDLGRRFDEHGPQPDVVSVKGHVDGAEWNSNSLDRFERFDKMDRWFDCRRSAGRYDDEVRQARRFVRRSRGPYV